MTEGNDTHLVAKPCIPVTPENSTTLTAPPAFASPITGPDVLNWTNGTRSPTLDTRKGRFALGRSGELVNLSQLQQRRESEVAKKASKFAKQVIREKKPNPAVLARQARALKAKDNSYENSQMLELCSKGRTTAAKPRKSTIDPLLIPSLDANDDDRDENSDCLSPAMHWKTLFQVHQRQ